MKGGQVWKLKVDRVQMARCDWSERDIGWIHEIQLSIFYIIHQVSWIDEQIMRN